MDETKDLTLIKLGLILKPKRNKAAGEKLFYFGGQFFLFSTPLVCPFI